MKSLINTALLKEQLKRFWLIAAFPMLFYILFIIVPIYNSDISYMEKVNYLVSVLSMTNPVMIITGIAVPLLAVFSSFSYLFQAKTTATMHSWPFNKKQLWATNVLAGLILMIVPLVILSIFLLIPIKWVAPEMTIVDGIKSYHNIYIHIPSELFPNGFIEGAAINSFSAVLSFFARAVLVFVFYYSVFIAAAFVAGNVPVYFALCAAFPFIPAALVALYEVAASFYCFGYVSDDRFITQVFTFTNPVVLPTQFNNYRPLIDDFLIRTNLLPYILVYILISVSLLAVSIRCGKIRHQERAADSVVFVPLKNVLVFLVSLGGMVLMGIFFLAMFGKVALMYVGFVIGFIIAYFIAQMIAEKTVNVLYKAKDFTRYALVALCGFLVIAAFTTFDITGFEKYVPEDDEIEGVYLGYSYYYHQRNNPIGNNDLLIKDDDVILNTAAIHKKIVENRSTLRRAFLKNMTGNNDTEPYELTKGKEITYMLKNGKIISRYYQMPYSFMEESGFNELLMSETVIMSDYSSFKHPDEISKLQLYYYDEGKSTEIAVDDAAQIKTALEVIKKDIMETAVYNYEYEKENAYTRDNVTEKAVEHSISGSVQLKADNNTTNNYRSYDGFNLEKSENTKAWLIKEGLLEK